MGEYQTGPTTLNPKPKQSISDNVLKYTIGLYSLLILIIPLLFIPTISYTDGYSSYTDGDSINKDRQSYVLNKLKSHDVVFLGTTHKKQPILKFLSDLLPNLHDAGVTHLGLEICSDQQETIDKFLQTGQGLADIKLHHPLDCEEYRNIFNIIRRIDRSKRPSVIALDLPKTMYRGKINRDEWMARSIVRIFRENPNAKALLVAGNLHVLKKIEWEDTVPNSHGFIRTYLSEFMPRLRAFSIGQCIDQTPNECDFTRAFSKLEGAVAMDCDGRFSDWKIGITRLVAAKPAKVWEILDGVIVY
jgi:hypothetical protein